MEYAQQSLSGSRRTSTELRNRVTWDLGWSDAPELCAGSRSVDHRNSAPAFGQPRYRAIGKVFRTAERTLSWKSWGMGTLSLPQTCREVVGSIVGLANVGKIGRKPNTGCTAGKHRELVAIELYKDHKSPPTSIPISRRSFEF